MFGLGSWRARLAETRLHHSAITGDGTPSSALLAQYCWRETLGCISVLCVCITSQFTGAVNIKQFVSLLEHFGYIRIGLVFAAWAAYETPVAFISLYSLCIFLDGVDGWLARRLGQTSRFGAWLDVAVDNLGRGMLWSLLFEGWLVSALEWCVFVCNHNTRGERWKNSFSSSPRLVQAIMANGFRTPLGVWVVSGLHCLPVWLYACQWGVLSHWLELHLWIQDVGMLLLAAGRLLALSVEVWCIWTHIEYLCSDEPEEKKS